MRTYEVEPMVKVTGPEQEETAMTDGVQGEDGGGVRSWRQTGKAGGEEGDGAGRGRPLPEELGERRRGWGEEDGGEAELGEGEAALGATGRRRDRGLGSCRRELGGRERGEGAARWKREEARAWE